MVPVFFWTPLVPGIIVFELSLKVSEIFEVIVYSEFELSPILNLI